MPSAILIDQDIVKIGRRYEMANCKRKLDFNHGLKQFRCAFCNKSKLEGWEPLFKIRN